MTRKHELRQKRGGLVAEMSSLVAKEIAGELNDDGRARFDALETEIRALEAQIERAEKAAAYERIAAATPINAESRAGREWGEMVGQFELRQVALALDEGRALTGATGEVVSELRERGGYRGFPVPWAALERRAGETVASGTPNPVQTMPIIERIFADSAAARMGASFVSVDSGAHEYTVCTSDVSAAWAPSETGAVGGPTPYETTDRPLAPSNTLGVTMRVTRKSLKQSGDALEQAIRRDMFGAIGAATDRAIFLGAGASGEPAGVLVGSYGIVSTAIDAAASWAAFRAAVTRFMIANAANSPAAVRLLIRPEVWDDLDGTLIAGTAVSEWDRLAANIPAANVVLSSNALAAPAGSPAATKALLTTTVGGVPPIFVATWGAIDLIRDPYSDATSGGLRLTALATIDVTVSRPSQLEILTGIQ